MKWRLGVTGSPIEHSLSPQLHEAGLAHAGLTGSSARLELDAANADRLRVVMGRDFDALAVTMPLKAAAAALCDVLDPAATRLGVVSSIAYREGELHGAMFDGVGLVAALNGEFDLDLNAKHVVILGSGGSARALVDAFVDAGAHSVVVHGRNAATVAAIVGRYDNVFDSMQVYRPVDLIVNTTPSASRPVEAAVRQGVTPDTVAVDVTYNPLQSPWLALHASSGCRTTNGLAMLAYVSACSLNWWLGTELSGATLLSVLR